MSQKADDQISAAIEKIVKLFKKAYYQKSGFPVYAIDGDSGNHLSKRDLLCEFDDYAPFFWYLGEHDYIIRQTRKIAKKLKYGRLLFSKPQIRKKKGLGLPGIFRKLPYADLQDYAEVLYGLSELYSMSGRSEFLDLAVKIFDRVVLVFERGRELKSFSLRPFGPTFSVADAMVGMFIEIALELSQVVKKESKRDDYCLMAKDWLNAWVNTEMYQKYGVFGSVDLGGFWSMIPGLNKKAKLSELAKPNASMAYGILTMAAPPFNDENAFEIYKTWVQGLYKYFSTGDCVLTQFPRFNDYDPYGPVLSTNFAILDILCDAVHLFNHQESKDLAMSIAKYFLDYQSPETGLVPDKPGETRSYLDANTDFSISLVKLSEITGNLEYFEAGQRILQGILTHHSAEFGYYRDVHLNTGEPFDPLVETRFCSLLLKPLILFRDNLTIYGDQGNWSMFRDR